MLLSYLEDHIHKYSFGSTVESDTHTIHAIDPNTMKRWGQLPTPKLSCTPYTLKLLVPQFTFYIVKWVKGRKNK